MFRIRKCAAFFLALLLTVTLLASCRKAEETPADGAPLSHDLATYEGADYILTYPACFTLVRDTGVMAEFAVKGGNMAFSLTFEENTYGTADMAELPDAMGIYNGVVPIDERSFGVEKYIPDMLSAYFLYTAVGERLYMIEYTFAGSEEQRGLEPLFRVEKK